MRNILVLLSLAAVLVVPGFAFGNPVAEALQKKYDGIDSMRAEFTQVLMHKESGSKETRKGTLLFKKPLLVRWETKTPSPELLVVSGKEIWNVFSDEEVAYKYPLSLVQDSRSIIRVITGQAQLNQDFMVENEGKEDGLTKLHLYPKEPVQALVEAIFWVDPNTSLIKKFRIYDFYGNQNEITFTSQSVGASVPASSFTYTPAKGFVVEDRTKETGAAPKRPLLQ